MIPHYEKMTTMHTTNYIVAIETISKLRFSVAERQIFSK